MVFVLQWQIDLVKTIALTHKVSVQLFVFEVKIYSMLCGGHHGACQSLSMILNVVHSLKRY